MGENSSIQWTHHTFNPWRGCTKISPGCANCYAETGSKRNPSVLGIWGDQGTRVVASEDMWRRPLAWNSSAKAAGERRRAFCASLADVCEDWQGPMVDSQGKLVRINEHGGFWSATPGFVERGGVIRPLAMDDVRERLFDLISDTPNLDWLLLTKRPENLNRMLPWTSEHAGQYRDRCWENVWIGTTVENQEQANKRIPILLSIPAKVRFLSMEPLIGPVDLTSLQISPRCESEDMDGNICGGQPLADALNRTERCDCTEEGSEPLAWNRLDWVIIGGESGPKARPFNLDWARSIRDQCREDGVAFFLKQLGSHPIGWHQDRLEMIGESHPTGVDSFVRWKLADSHGGDPAEWPRDLRNCRHFPALSEGRLA